MSSLVKRTSSHSQSTLEPQSDLPFFGSPKRHNQTGNSLHQNQFLGSIKRMATQEKIKNLLLFLKKSAQEILLRRMAPPQSEHFVLALIFIILDSETPLNTRHLVFQFLRSKKTLFTSSIEAHRKELLAILSSIVEITPSPKEQETSKGKTGELAPEPGGNGVKIGYNEELVLVVEFSHFFLIEAQQESLSIKRENKEELFLKFFWIFSSKEATDKHNGVNLLLIDLLFFLVPSNKSELLLCSLFMEFELAPFEIERVFWAVDKYGKTEEFSVETFRRCERFLKSNKTPSVHVAFIRLIEKFNLAQGSWLSGSPENDFISVALKALNQAIKDVHQSNRFHGLRALSLMHWLPQEQLLSFIKREKFDDYADQPEANPKNQGAKGKTNPSLPSFKDNIIGSISYSLEDGFHQVRLAAIEAIRRFGKASKKFNDESRTLLFYMTNDQNDEVDIECR